MNKIDLINQIASRTGSKKKDAAAFMEAELQVITEALASGETVSLVGFGSFNPLSLTSREGRNPKTGESYEISARKVVKFKVGNRLRQAVRDS